VRRDWIRYCLAVEVSKFRSGCSGNVWGGLVWSVTLRLGSLGGVG